MAIPEHIGEGEGGSGIFRNGGVTQNGGVVFEMGGLNPSTNYGANLIITTQNKDYQIRPSSFRMTTLILPYL